MKALSCPWQSTRFWAEAQEDTILLVPTSTPTGCVPWGASPRLLIRSSASWGTRVYLVSPPMLLPSCPALGGLVWPRGGEGLLVAGLFLEPPVIAVLPLAAD